MSLKLVLLVSLFYANRGGSFELEFLEDCFDYFNAKKPVVFSTENGNLHSLAYKRQLSIIDSVELVNLTTQWSSDFLFIDKRVSLIDTLVSELLKSNVTVMLPWTDYKFKSKLRLDSRLYIYKAKSDRVDVYERYAINGGHNIVQRIGNWTRGRGFKIEITNVWERRSDLRGAVVNLCDLNTVSFR